MADVEMELGALVNKEKKPETKSKSSSSPKPPKRRHESITNHPKHASQRKLLSDSGKKRRVDKRMEQSRRPVRGPRRPGHARQARPSRQQRDRIKRGTAGAARRNVLQWDILCDLFLVAVVNNIFTHGIAAAQDGDYALLYTIYFQFGCLMLLWMESFKIQAIFGQTDTSDAWLRYANVMAILGMGASIGDLREYYRSFLLTYALSKLILICMYGKNFRAHRSSRKYCLYFIITSVLELILAFSLSFVIRRDNSSSTMLAVWGVYFALDQVCWSLLSLRTKITVRVWRHMTQRLSLLTMLMLAVLIVYLVISLNASAEGVKLTIYEKLIVVAIATCFIYFLASLYMRDGFLSWMSGSHVSPDSEATLFKWWLLQVVHCVWFFCVLGFGIGFEVITQDWESQVNSNGKIDSSTENILIFTLSLFLGCAVLNIVRFMTFLEKSSLDKCNRFAWSICIISTICFGVLAALWKLNFYVSVGVVLIGLGLQVWVIDSKLDTQALTDIPSLNDNTVSSNTYQHPKFLKKQHSLLGKPVGDASPNSGADSEASDGTAGRGTKGGARSKPTLGATNSSNASGRAKDDIAANKGAVRTRGHKKSQTMAAGKELQLMRNGSNVLPRLKSQKSNIGMSLDYRSRRDVMVRNFINSLASVPFNLMQPWLTYSVAPLHLNKIFVMNTWLRPAFHQELNLCVKALPHTIQTMLPEYNDMMSQIGESDNKFDKENFMRSALALRKESKRIVYKIMEESMNYKSHIMRDSTLASDGVLKNEIEFCRNNYDSYKVALFYVLPKDKDVWIKDLEANKIHNIKKAVRLYEEVQKTLHKTYLKSKHVNVIVVIKNPGIALSAQDKEWNFNIYCDGTLSASLNGEEFKKTYHKKDGSVSWLYHRAKRLLAESQKSTSVKVTVKPLDPPAADTKAQSGEKKEKIGKMGGDDGKDDRADSPFEDLLNMSGDEAETDKKEEVESPRGGGRKGTDTVVMKNMASNLDVDDVGAQSYSESDTGNEAEDADAAKKE